MSSTKKHYATRDFKDAGTEKTFTAGAPVDATDGELANYKAAGLVTDEEPKAVAAKADKGSDSGKPA